MRVAEVAEEQGLQDHQKQKEKNKKLFEAVCLANGILLYTQVSVLQGGRVAVCEV